MTLGLEPVFFFKNIEVRIGYILVISNKDIKHIKYFPGKSELCKLTRH